MTGGVVLAVLGVVVLVVAILALRHPKDTGTAPGSTTPQPSTSTGAQVSPSTSVSPSTKPSPSTTPTTSSPSGPKKVALIVLSNSDVHGLAATAAAQFIAGGWTVTRTGSWTVYTISPAAYYDPQVADAKSAAEALQKQFPKIQRVLPPIWAAAERADRGRPHF
jgi:hypothetical protein